MALFCWILAAWTIIGTLITITSVGKVRTPMTGGAAAVAALINAAVVTGLALTATGVLR
ncbi:hypothetical protein [Kitasatospora sp. NPDC090091]|uniref:hypothetical protein n=1 Tax=Kitasatospora sp. NPDC090091 TaxID=3364081 RepID=UPI00380C177E